MLLPGMSSSAHHQEIYNLISQAKAFVLENIVVKVSGCIPQHPFGVFLDEQSFYLLWREMDFYTEITLVVYFS
jgi:hypothetical protein